MGGAWIRPTWARYVYHVFYGEKNGIHCACANCYRALSPLCGRPGYEASSIIYYVLACMTGRRALRTTSSAMCWIRGRNRGREGQRKEAREGGSEGQRKEAREGGSEGQRKEVREGGSEGQREEQ